MTDYSAVFLDHYRRPRNLGDLEEPDAVAIVHDDVCGDLLRLAAAIEPVRCARGSHRRRIRSARFKAYGCAATIAVASVLTEMVTGRLVEDAAELTSDHLIAALGGLPPGRVHAAVLGAEALRAVIATITRETREPPAGDSRV